MTSPFHFPSLVWGESIAIYLFLLGISAGATTLSVLLKRKGLAGADPAQNNIIRCNAFLAPITIMSGLILLIFHLARPWTFWFLMFNYSSTSIMSAGVMGFQLYMLFLVLWLVIIFQSLVLTWVQRLMPKMLAIATKAVALITGFSNIIEIILLTISIFLGAYTGFLLSALISYPMLNNPVLPILFLASGTSSGIAALVLCALFFTKASTTSKDIHYLHHIEYPVVIGEAFLLFAFFFGLYLGGGQKTVAFYTALGGGFWSYVFWIGVVAIGIVLPLALETFSRDRLKQRRSFAYTVAICTLIGVLCLRFFILYAGQMTLA